jgi:radical SAM superfamily enzyme with C-terminal helix-hairpin-helix motif
MDAGLYSNSFSEVFSKILGDTGVSCYQIHTYTNLDQGYLSRLKASQKTNPSPETIMKISLGLVHCSPKVTLLDIDNLFKSVGRSLRA